MSDRERNIDLTPSSPPAPLPAPTTVSNRSLRPRRQQARASAEAGARSSTVSSSRSRSRSESGSSQLLYPEDPDSPEYLADSPANPPGRVSPRPEEPLDAAESSRTNNGVVSNSIAGDASSDGVATTGTKRRRSPSPVASSSRSEKRKGKRRALDTTDVPPDASDAVGLGTNEGSSSTHVSSEAAASVGSSAKTTSVSQHSSVAEAPAARDSQNTRLSHAIADDPAAAFERMMSEHSSTSRAHDTPADVPPSANVPPSTRGAVASDVPFLEDFTFQSISGSSTCPVVLSPTSDHGQPNDTETTPKAEAQRQRPVDTVPIDEVEPLAAYTCPICFSPPSYATITPCGHVLCGECLFTAVKTTIQRGAYTLPAGERMTARCPVCRAPIPGWDGKGGGVIGLRPRAVFSL